MQLSKFRQRFSIRYPAAGFICGLIPLAVLSLLVWLSGGQIVNKHIYLSDALVYWSQAATFAEAGFNGGYYTVNEQPAPLEAVRFYAWGPGIAVFYGMIARLVGWALYTPVLVNLAVVCAGVTLWTVVVHPTMKQMLALIVLLIGFPSLVMYAPLALVQVLNLGIALLVASLCYRVIQTAQITPRLMVIVTVCLVLVSLIRVTWSLVLLPLYLIYALQDPTAKRIAVNLLMAAGLIAMLFGLQFIWSAPYPGELSAIIEQFSISWFSGFDAFLRNIVKNTGRLFQGNSAQLIVRLQMLIIVLYAGYRLYRYRSHQAEQTPAIRAALFHLLNLGVTFLLVVSIYDVFDWRDFRVFAPPVFLSLLLLIAEKKLWLVAGLMGLSLLSYSSIVPHYQSFMQDFHPDRAYTDELQQTARRLEANGVQYNPAASSGWCNTILYASPYLNRPAVLLAFDGGMGLSWLQNDRYLREAPKSQYLLLSEQTPLPDTLDTELILSLPDGRLYRNNDASCANVESD